MTTTTDRLASRSLSDLQGSAAGEAPNVPADPTLPDTHGRRVGGDTSPEQATGHAAPKADPPARPQLPADHRPPGPQGSPVGGDLDIRSGQRATDAHARSAAAEQTPHPARHVAQPMRHPPGGASTGGDQAAFDSQTACVAAPTPPAPARSRSAPTCRAPVRADLDDRPATRVAPTPIPGPSLADPVLTALADFLDDVEQVHNANANRLRTLTETKPDKDGVMRGHGIPADDPPVRAVAALVDASRQLEEQATRDLQRLMRAHPLAPWAKSQRGVGDKQLARLLAAIGDPYWMKRADGEERPRTVAELRSYAGWGDGRRQVRRRGEKANWSDTAKKRTWVIADSCKRQLCANCKASRPEGQIWADRGEGCMCSPYRVIYDQARRKYADTLHDIECRRCGPKGKPAQPGSPRSAAHQEAMAYRVVCKAILRDLWREAARLHGADVEASLNTRGAANRDSTPIAAAPSPGAGTDDTDTRETARGSTPPKRSSPSPGADTTEPPAGAARRAPGDPRRQSTAPPPDTHERTGTT